MYNFHQLLTQTDCISLRNKNDPIKCICNNKYRQNGIQLKLNAVDFSPLPASESEEVIVERTTAAVSYTHLDVYKRQAIACPMITEVRKLDLKQNS